MGIIQTPSFKLATISAGNPDSEKISTMIPGRLDTKDYINFTSHMKYLADRGYYAVAFDPPGTWESQGDVEFTTTNLVKAVNELIEHFGSKPTLLLGHSRGGQTAMLVGTTNPSVNGLVMVNASYGPPSPPDQKKVQNGYLIEHRDIPPGDRKTEEQREFHLSLNYFTDGAQYDPIPGMKSCIKPKLLINAVDDEWNEPEEIRAIFDVIPEPKMLHEMEGKHDYRRDAKRIEEVNQVLGEFIQKYHL